MEGGIQALGQAGGTDEWPADHREGRALSALGQDPNEATKCVPGSPCNDSKEKSLDEDWGGSLHEKTKQATQWDKGSFQPE